MQAKQILKYSYLAITTFCLSLPFAQVSLAYRNDMTLTPLYNTDQPRVGCNQKDTVVIERANEFEKSLDAYLFLRINSSPLSPSCINDPMSCANQFMVSRMADRGKVSFTSQNYPPLQAFVAEITDNAAAPIDVSKIIDLNFTACPYSSTVSNLVPGNGLPASVSNLGSLGPSSNQYYTQKVIARWLTPHEDIIGGMIDNNTPEKSSIKLCAAAFHPNGVAQADFIIKPEVGAPGFRTVTSQTMDLESGVPAYCVNVNSEDVTPGRFRAEVVFIPSTAGIPQYLRNDITSEVQARNGEHSLIVYNNRATATTAQRLPRKVIHIKKNINGGRAWLWNRNNPLLPPTIFPACGTQADPCDNMASALEATTYANYLAGLGTHSVDGGILQFDDAGPQTFGYPDQTYSRSIETEIAPYTVRGYGIRETILDQSAQIPGMPGSTWGGNKINLVNLTLKPPRIGEVSQFPPTKPIVASPTGGGLGYSSVVAQDVDSIGRGWNPSDCWGGGDVGGFQYSFSRDSFTQSIRGNPSFNNHVRTFMMHISSIPYSNVGGLFNSGADYVRHDVSTLCGLPQSTSPHADLRKYDGSQRNAMGINYVTGAAGNNITQGWFLPDLGIQDIYEEGSTYRIGAPNGSAGGGAVLRIGPVTGVYAKNVKFIGGGFAYSVYDPTIPAVYNPNYVYQKVRFFSSFDGQVLPNPDGQNGAVTQSNMGPSYTGPSGVTYTQQ